MEEANPTSYNDHHFATISPNRILRETARNPTTTAAAENLKTADNEHNHSEKCIFSETIAARGE